MKIYIEEKDMPKSCFYCPCYHHKVDDGYYDYEICRASGTVFNDGYASVTGHKNHIDPFKARLDNCPLVTIPPHGDLIDRDALTISTAVPLDGKPYQYVHIDNIESAPPIIESDESDMDSFIRIFKEDNEEDGMDSFIRIFKD